jgi:opacity protein-like surface antigen
MIFRFSLCTVGLNVAAVFSAPVAAADDHWYALARAGLVGQSNQDLTLSNVLPATRGTLELDQGALIGGSFGRAFSNGWRLEGEFTYQGVDGSLTGASPALNGSGDYASTSFALNALYEFDLLGSPRARTYVGLGAVWITEVDLDVGGLSNYSASKNAWQALFGARYDLGEKWFLDAGFRYLSASGVNLEAESGGGRASADYRPWAATIGIGLKF